MLRARTRLASICQGHCRRALCSATLACPWATLGLNRDSGRGEIKRAYYELAIASFRHAEVRLEPKRPTDSHSPPAHAHL